MTHPELWPAWMLSTLWMLATLAVSVLGCCIGWWIVYRVTKPYTDAIDEEDEP